MKWGMEEEEALCEVRMQGVCAGPGIAVCQPC